jgi:hypothetical protein
MLQEGVNQRLHCPIYSVEEFSLDRQGRDIHAESHRDRADQPTKYGGAWESTESKADSYDEWVIEANGGGWPVVHYPVQKERLNMKFDGKDYTDSGPKFGPGWAASGERINEHAIELTYKLKDQVLDHQDLKDSADGKTLTAVRRYSGEKKPETLVYDRRHENEGELRPCSAPFVGLKKSLSGRVGRYAVRRCRCLERRWNCPMNRCSCPDRRRATC